MWTRGASAIRHAAIARRVFCPSSRFRRSFCQVSARRVSAQHSIATRVLAKPTPFSHSDSAFSCYFLLVSGHVNDDDFVGWVEPELERNDVSDEDGEDDDVDAIKDEDRISVLDF
ncbi:uncharacterized protein DS421_11g339490 [Arachis hypogaea]|nr:uncharacterized protein DS421_11g339490 [Arachis hypogaea]